MKFINYIFLFFLSLGITSLVAIFQDSPGYMDADYYYAGGVRLAQGFGFSDPFLWNFLDDPQGLPHPSHTYWMPLPSILVMLGMALSGAENFTGGKLLYFNNSGIYPCNHLCACLLAYGEEAACSVGWHTCCHSWFLFILCGNDRFIRALYGAWRSVLVPGRPTETVGA